MPAPRPVATSPGRGWWWIALALAVALWWMWSSSRGAPVAPEVPYTTAIGYVREGKVKSAVVDDTSLDGQFVSPQLVHDRIAVGFRTNLPKDDRLVPLLDNSHVQTTVPSSQPPLLLRIALDLLPWLFIIGLWVWLSRRARNMMVAGGGGPLAGFLKRGRRFEKSTLSTVTFTDVAGLTAAKRDLAEIVAFLKDSTRFHRLGARIPRGVLLVGPPGAGKTLLARAVAGEADVPFYSITASEFVEMFVGIGAARVRELFDEAKKNAPAIVFIDEIDAVGRARGSGLGGGHDEREQTLNQLLAEMDGFERNDLVVVMAATNRPDVLDAALLRPGRFDRRVVVDLPEAGARRAILALHTRDKPLGPDVDLDRLAQTTAGFSGADLANLANEAALSASRRGGDSLTSADFSSAFDKIVLGDPREGKLRDSEKQRVAIHEAGHAIVAWATPDAEPLRRVSILPRGMTLGATQQVPPEDRHLHTRSELAARLLVLLGGYASESVMFGEVSTGGENNLREATRLAEKMVAHYGMSTALGPVYYEVRDEHPFLGHRIATDGGTSDATTHSIEQEARKLLAETLAGALAAIAEHDQPLRRLVAELLERETLEREDLERVLGPAATRPDAVPIEAPVPPSRR